MKKMKELRMTIFMTILCVVALYFTIHSFVIKALPQALVGSFICFIGLINLAFRFNIMIYDDMMMIYEWKILALLPLVIQYEDIKSVKVKNRFVVQVDHKKISNVYVFNAQAFVNAYQSIKNN